MANDSESPSSNLFDVGSEHALIVEGAPRRHVLNESACVRQMQLVPITLRFDDPISDVPCTALSLCSALLAGTAVRG
jgi:hypothetical protein